MFCECSKLTKLNLDNFCTKNVTNMSKMFFNCSSLKILGLKNFYIGADTIVDNMFGGCIPELKKKIIKSNLYYKKEAFYDTNF